MSLNSPPQASDIRLSIPGENAWQVYCPARLKGHSAVQGAAGLVAGAVLGMVSIGGIAEVMTQPSWGAQLFVIGWLGPLGIIAALLAWIGGKTLARVWQSTIVESDGTIVRHRTHAPWGQRIVLEVPTAWLEPLQPPTAEETPELADPGLRRAYTGPLVLRYRRSTGERLRDHQCMVGVRYDELVWLASALNPFIERARSERKRDT